MFDPHKPEDVQAMLLHIATASSGAPHSRARVRRWLRAALDLVDDDAAEPLAKVSPATAGALRELADGLGIVAEQADVLAEQAAARVTGNYPPG